FSRDWSSDVCSSDLWDEQQDAYSVRATLCDILAACGFTNGTSGVAAGQVEVFPKQDAVPADGYGNMFVLPLAGKSVALDASTFRSEERRVGKEGKTR